MFDELLLPQVAPLDARHAEDRCRRTDSDAGGGKAGATAQCGGLEAIDALRLERQFGRDLGERVHVCGRGCQQQARLAIGIAEALAYLEDIRLLPGSVDAVAARLQGCLDGHRAVLHERADGVAHDLCTLEDSRESIDRVLGLDDLAGGRLEAHYTL